jgi:hypothetical protein
VTKRLPRIDARRHLSLSDLLALRGCTADQLERRFGSMEQVRLIYAAHREKIDLRPERAGYRSACWWIFTAPPDLWPIYTANDPAGHAEQDAHRLRRILWLAETGELSGGERREIIAQAKRDIDPPNPAWPPSPETRESARQLLEALEDAP